MTTTPDDLLLATYLIEEKLRGKSLTTVRADPVLSEHWNFVAEAMNAIYAFTHDHEHGSYNELILQYLGGRLFNAGCASIKLALSGYYQNAFHQVRDIIETHFLVDYLVTYPAKIDEWRRADEKERKGRFGPNAIRNALDKRDQLGSHASYPSIALTTTGPNYNGEIGPFFDEQKLRVWLEELARRLSHAALPLLRNPEGHDPKLLKTRRHYTEVAVRWVSKYHELDAADIAFARGAGLSKEG